MGMTPRDKAIDGYRSYELAIEALRETCIRSGSIQPRSDRPDEVRWSREGYRGPAELDSVRHATVKAFMDGE